MQDGFCESLTAVTLHTSIVITQNNPRCGHPKFILGSRMKGMTEHVLCLRKHLHPGFLPEFMLAKAGTGMTRQVCKIT